MATEPAPARLRDGGRRWRRAALAFAVLVPLVAVASPAQAASSKGCVDGGFELVNRASGVVVASARTGDVAATVSAAGLGSTFLVRGRYNEFLVDAADFAVRDYAFTGAPNELDITGGRRTPVLASKIPNHRGLALTSGVTVELQDEDLIIGRTGPGLSMKIQAKDCAQGGIFQMEPERADGTRTRIVHMLATAANGLQPFYFDNPIFRAPPGSFSALPARTW